MKKRGISLKTAVQKHWSGNEAAKFLTHPTAGQNVDREDFFNELITKWLKEINNISNPTTMMKSPSFKALLAWGDEAIPKAIERMKRGGEWPLCLLLRKIAGNVVVVPKKDRGKMDRVVRLWIEWYEGKKNDLRTLR
ncbi:MAG: hypothetical protein Q8K86_07050 [Candidatus Nanopelagicaceae bacterium]|nr:hypothetical protein [Candidatus Nanopelagicaceae bacterium]